jgi:hypothetical protein
MANDNPSRLTSGKNLSHLLELTRLVGQETISLAEAQRRAISNANFLSDVSLNVAIRFAWNTSCESNVEVGHIAASLIYDWATATLPDQPNVAYKAGRVLVLTATQVLLERADADLYLRIASVAEKLVASARLVQDHAILSDALMIASRPHLEPYAANPALDPRKSNFPWMRLLPKHKQECRAWMVHEELGNEMPAPTQALSRADHYLSEAAALTDNTANRASALVHRALVLHSAALF